MPAAGGKHAGLNSGDLVADSPYSGRRYSKLSVSNLYPTKKYAFTPYRNNHRWTPRNLTHNAIEMHSPPRPSQTSVNETDYSHYSSERVGDQMFGRARELDAQLKTAWARWRHYGSWTHAFAICIGSWIPSLFCWPAIRSVALTSLFHSLHHLSVMFEYRFRTIWMPV